jgi:hypothetical protein
MEINLKSIGKSLICQLPDVDDPQIGQDVGVQKLSLCQLCQAFFFPQDSHRVLASSTNSVDVSGAQVLNWSWVHFHLDIAKT